MKEIFNLINEADAVLIGAGSGLSTAAGIDYAGDEFKKDFKKFIEKYGFTDLYTSSFYDFKSQEEFWAYWSKHIYFANVGREGTELYKKIYNAVKDKDYFVITTNVDDQFYKTGFDKDRIFRVQGSYKYIQCSMACHKKIYDDEKIVKNMISNIDENLRVPTDLVPRCPVCGETMEPNLRKDAYFVQDDLWYEQSEAYNRFIDENSHKNVVLLEFGVGFNTPGIIRFPFEQMVFQNRKWTLVRFNLNCETLLDLEDRFVEVKDDINEIFK